MPGMRGGLTLGWGRWSGGQGTVCLVLGTMKLGTGAPGRPGDGAQARQHPVQAHSSRNTALQFRSLQAGKALGTGAQHGWAAPLGPRHYERRTCAQGERSPHLAMQRVLGSFALERCQAHGLD